jgi:hypothetical protein
MPAEFQNGTVMRDLAALPADAAAWRSARTLEDIGNLAAQWWRGVRRWMPGQDGRGLPVRESLPDYLAFWAIPDACRAGFVVWTGTNSGGQVRLLGFVAEQASPFTSLDPGPGVSVQEARGSRGRRLFADATTPVRIPRRTLADAATGFGICHPDGVRAVCDARQVTVTGPPDMVYCLLVKLLLRRVIS